MCREVALFAEWYNGFRPHRALYAATPDELYYDRQPAATATRFEPRRRWPRGLLAPDRRRALVAEEVNTSNCG